jgi:uncharacterized protein YdeI (YjbR/CyaY-like superfamily)
LPPRDTAALEFANRKAWAGWLDKNHSQSSGIWMRLAKKASGGQSVSYSEALEVALCYGWIDGQKRSDGEAAWLQKFIPRANKSNWSKINRKKMLALIEAGRMKPAGLQAIERAKADGSWDAAYDSPSTAIVPGDLQAALDKNPRAKTFFSTLDSQNRYAVLYRIQTVKKAETRSRKIQQFVEMLARNEKLHP